jgi:hypothetical protein
MEAIGAEADKLSKAMSSSITWSQGIRINIEDVESSHLMVCVMCR